MNFCAFFVRVIAVFIVIVFNADVAFTIPSAEIQSVNVVVADVHIEFFKDVFRAVRVSARDRNVVFVFVAVVFEINQTGVGVEFDVNGFAGGERDAADFKFVARFVCAAVGRDVNRRRFAVSACRER